MEDLQDHTVGQINRKEIVGLKTVFGEERCSWGANHWQGKTYEIRLGDAKIIACTAHLIDLRKMINRAEPPEVE